MVMDNQALQFTNKLGQMLDDMCMVNMQTRASKQLTFQLHNNGQSDARAQLFPDKADTSFVSTRQDKARHETHMTDCVLPAQNR